MYYTNNYYSAKSVAKRADNKPFIKDFYRDGTKNKKWHFKFKILNEGGQYEIYILEAPALQTACGSPHHFHILGSSSRPRVCWDRSISSFKSANAIMYVWVDCYCKTLKLYQSNPSWSAWYDHDGQAHGKIARLLPSGTFRSSELPERKVYLKKGVYDEIMGLLGERKPELGGMLGSNGSSDHVTEFVFDSKAKVTGAEYNPNVDFLNGILESWENEGIYFVGFVHSHPGDFNRLSGADVDYAIRIMEAFGMSTIFMPIVTSSYAYRSTMTPYLVHLDGKVEKVELEVYEESEETLEEIEGISEEELEEIKAAFSSMEVTEAPSVSTPSSEEKEEAPVSGNDIFARIRGSMDLEYLAGCTLIGIGCGGARLFYEDLARMGVGRFVLMDGDKNDLTNVATQGVYLSEVGSFKATSVARRLENINPLVEVKAIDAYLDESMDDEEFEKEVLGSVDLGKCLLCAFTDDFAAQARIFNLALKFHLPLLAAQHHKLGYTSEVVYYYPGVTETKPQEICSSRYESYRNGYRNDVTSRGSPCFNTTRLNSLCEKLAVGMLLFAADPNSNYCSFLLQKPNSNLIIIRQHYLMESDNPFRFAFDNTDSSLFDDVIWVDTRDSAEKAYEPSDDTRDIYGA